MFFFVNHLFCGVVLGPISSLLWCCSVTFHQVSVTSDQIFGSRLCLKNPKNATLAASWMSEYNKFSNNQNLHVAKMIPPRLCLLQHMVQEDMSFEKNQNGCHDGHLGHQNPTILAILTFHFALMPTPKFCFKRRCHFKNTATAAIFGYRSRRSNSERPSPTKFWFNRMYYLEMSFNEF